MIFNQTNAALVSIRDLKILRNLTDFWMKLSYLLFFFPFLLLNICLCGCLNPALLSDLTKHIWHTLIRLALADSESLSPSLSLSLRQNRPMYFVLCSAVVSPLSRSVLSTWPLSCTRTQCFIRLFSAVRVVLH